MTEIKNIAIVGSGNIAKFLAAQLNSKNFLIQQIISRNPETGRQLAEQYHAIFSQDYKLSSNIDLAILCVPDGKIKECAVALGTTNAMVCHCAGSISISVLNQFEKHGVLYPLQSLSGLIDSSSSEVPFLIEANTESCVNELKTILNKLDYSYRIVNSEDRLHYHLAAVYINNFTNAMVMAATDITEKYQIDFSLLQPLLYQTFEKLKHKMPFQTQTGPAKRKDLITIEKHMELLKTNKELLEIYKVVSQYITSKFNL